MKDTTTEETGYQGKPIQTLSWAEKEANKKSWYKKNADFYIKGSSRFGKIVEGNGQRDLGQLYDAYNSKFPLNWFKHITDPLSAKVPAHKAFPAKIRPVTILRTNIDLLMSEYPRRPFIYQVENLGEGGYNNYLESLNNKLQGVINNYFNQQFQQSLAGQPQDPNNPPQPPPLPDEIQQDFQKNYKDAIAVKCQRWLNRAMKEYKIKSKLLKQFKDWLIVGEAYSYKGLLHGSFVYERVSPMMIDYDKSDETDMIEDASWVVARRLMTTADIVDRFYEDLKKQDILTLEKGNMAQSPEAFYNYLTESASTVNADKHDVYHAVWKGRKEIKIIHYFDPETGEPAQKNVDEDYPVGDEEVAESIWVNEVYETWRIDKDLYLKMGPIAVQRNEMNNFSACKLPYNGRRFSDTHSVNISPLEIGIPFQIMYIIVTRALELTIAKSKGKIVLIDQNVIPNQGDWTEEKFFYYAESLGYALVNRNQIGVDKTFNQYQVLDMSLFDNIKQLIELQAHFKQEWDDVLGINRQRKGQTYASDLVGVTERATFQSTVITDMIFNLFEEYVETELQGIIDYSKFVNVDGVKAMYNNDMYETELLEIDPNTYCNADLGISVQNSSEAIGMKNKLEGTVTAMLQNKVRPSTVAEVIRAVNIPDLIAKLKQIEKIEDDLARQQQQDEAKMQEDADARKEKFLNIENELKTKYMNAEYDRKEDIELIVADAATLTFKNGDSDANGIPDAMEIDKRRLEREKLEADNAHKNADRSLKQTDMGIKAGQKDAEIRIKDRISKKKPTATK